MKCPLFCIGDYSVELLKDNPAFDCLGEECARWDKRHGICGDLLEAQACDRIADYLEYIADKMPHEEQFRK